MSRVTIGDITEDLVPFTEKGNKVVNVEIVPRKIVEDIIKQCVTLYMNSEYGAEGKGVRMASWSIRNYAIGLLDEFEKGGAE